MKNDRLLFWTVAITLALWFEGRIEFAPPPAPADDAGPGPGPLWPPFKP